MMQYAIYVHCVQRLNFLRKVTYACLVWNVSAYKMHWYIVYEGIRIKKVAHSSHYTSVFVLNGKIYRKMPHHIFGIRYPKSFVKFFILSKNHYLGFLIPKHGKLRSFSWSRNPEVLLVVFWSHLGIVYDGFYGHQSQWVASIFDFRIFDKLEIILDIESSQPIGLMSLFW